MRQKDHRRWPTVLLVLTLVSAATGCTSLAGAPAAPSPPTVVEGNEPVVEIRDVSRNNSANAARIELLERSDRTFDGGAFLHWDGEEDRLLVGTKLEGADTPVLTLTRSGHRVGIGTASPASRLDVEGTTTTQGLIVEAAGPRLTLRDTGGDNRTDTARLELLERAGGSFDGGGYLRWNGADDRMILGTVRDGTDSALLVLDRSSQSVGIGTLDPQSRLSVDGRITAREVTVTVDGWADDVFEAGYPLLPLDELARRIERDGHLPGVPSASEVTATGVPLGSMQSTLLRKVEELTLYVLELRRENEQLERRLLAVEGAR